MWKQFIVAFVKCRSTQDELIQDDWTRKRRKGIGKRRCKTSPKDSSWQHPRYHQASYSTSCSSWWSETYLWTHLRGDPWSPQGLPWERHPWCCHLHRARQEEDRHCHGCCLRSEEARTYLVRIRWINFIHGTHKNGYFYSHTSLKEITNHISCSCVILTYWNSYLKCSCKN